MLYLLLIILRFCDANRQEETSVSFENESVFPFTHGHLSKRDTVEVCNSTSCKILTSKLLYLMNQNANPCENFPEYICGNQNSLKDIFLIKDRTLESLEKFLMNNMSNSDQDQYDFNTFYHSCLDFQVEFAFSEILEFSLNQQYGTLTDVLVDMIMLQSFPFFDVGLDIEKDTEKYIFQITLPGESALPINIEGWSLKEHIRSQCANNLKDSLSTKTDLNDMYDIFRECENEALESLINSYGKNINLISGVNDTEVLLREIFNMQQIFHIPIEEKRKAKVQKIFKPMSVAEMMVEYDMVNWIQLFEKITTNKTFSGKEIVHVYFPSYIKKLFDHFKTIEERKLMNMLQGYFRLELYKNLLQFIGNNKRSLCMSLVQQLMPDITRKILYEQQDSTEKSNGGLMCHILFDKLKNQLKESVEQSKLKDETKLAFANKLNRLKFGQISSVNSFELQDNYIDLNITKNFIENLVGAMRNHKKIIFSHVNKIATAPSLLKFFVNPMQDRPQAFYTSNTIVLHPGIFNRVPSSLPEYIKAAKFGLLLSQEILKHFDPTGVLMESDGAIKDDHYENMIRLTTELLHGYYLNISFVYHGRTLNFQNISRDNLLNELISDNAAFRLITDLYESLPRQQIMPWIRDDFTVKQIFLIAASQEFCGRYSEVDLIRDLFERGRVPLSLKIQNMISNSAFFSEAFECPDGSEMSLNEELRIQFPYFHESVVYDYENGNDYN